MDVNLFEWYMGQLGILRPPFNIRRIAQQLWGMQTRYNRATGRKCRGLQFLHVHPTERLCRQPLCPTCWYLRQRRTLDRLETISPGVTFVRETVPFRWNEPVDPAVLQAFKARRRRQYTLVAYTVNFEACAPIITPDIEQGDTYQGEMGYTLLGVFQSPHVHQERRFRDVYREQIPPAQAAAVWLQRVQAPWAYRRHPRFNDYLTHFDPQIGNSWGRVQKEALYGQSSCQGTHEEDWWEDTHGYEEEVRVLSA